MLFSGILTAVGIVAISAKFSKGFLQKVLGYEWAVDAVITLGLPLLFLGTYSGMMTAIVTGLCISLVLFCTGNIIGRQKIKKINGKRQWVLEKGTWTPEYFGNKARTLFNGYGDFVSSFKKGWDKSAANKEAIAQCVIMHILKYTAGYLFSGLIRCIEKVCDAFSDAWFFIKESCIYWKNDFSNLHWSLVDIPFNIKHLFTGIVAACVETRKELVRRVNTRNNANDSCNTGRVDNMFESTFRWARIWRYKNVQEKNDGRVQ